MLRAIIKKFQFLVTYILIARGPTRPIRFATFFDSCTKDMQIFTEDKKNQTISEARTEYLQLAANLYELDNLSDTA